MSESGGNTARSDGRFRSGTRRRTVEPAPELPVARVLVDVSPHHLDRPFDYLVPSHFDVDAVPGCRVRVRFNGRLLDGFLLERLAESDYRGRLAWLQRVVSSEPVLAGELLELVRAVARRYAGTLNDVARLAVPPRHARVENEAAPERPDEPPEPPEASAWSRYEHGAAFLRAVREGRPARAVWQALPDEDWPVRLAELAATAAVGGRPVILVVPDHRDLARLTGACAASVGDRRMVSLSSELGQAERYRRWLAVRRGDVRIVVGTRAAMFAPVVPRPGLMVVWDDGDQQHLYPTAPYPHVRDVLTHRAHSTGSALLIGGFARTAEAELLVESGWAGEILADRAEVRAAAPRVTAIGEDDTQLARDPTVRSARLPSIAFEAVRQSLRDGAPVLVQVPRKGYMPALACARCGERATCRQCAGPLSVAAGTGRDDPNPPVCRWCGVAEARFRCVSCGNDRLRAVVIGAARTAEELSRAFGGVTVRTSGGERALDHVPAGPALVVATPGVEPTVAGGYGAALLLDARAMLSRPELRAGEQALRRWFAAAAMVRPAGSGGRVVVLAESELAPVQALMRWDPSWYAARELVGRAELGYPPAKRVASVDGSPEAVGELLDGVSLPEGGEVLGPVPLGEVNEEGEAERERALLRVDRARGRSLAEALYQAQVERGRSGAGPVRVQLDPLEPI
ncbi:replication restart DNA helicase PriA [Actinopolyspora xinjiangensis]|uniref:Probable replication restart protein PriA n=1 Tax=Actinopolyspora xinjiangensis TaxID=405564 RepID=A0A1H0WF24_9ACTN|nr:primosomal protein N' [Actinopolyspora xinjiangensis]SDP89330.1 replication restart DNA helicase PriA [Actinopolyspora xinjiangensis]